METAKELEEKTDVLSAYRDELEKLLFQMQDRETKVKKLSKQINETEKAMTSKKLRLSKLSQMRSILPEIFLSAFMLICAKKSQDLLSLVMI